MDAAEQALDRHEQDFLLDVARKTIVARAGDDKQPAFASDNPKLNCNCGAFVTLKKKNGALRGCIGHVEAHGPLLPCVSDMAVACCSRDPRFSPVTTDELSDLDLEISVLTPLEEIRRAEEVCIGLHGLMIKKGSASGLLLPQVASEHGWKRERFVEETCRKAGLGAGAWKEPEARLFTFSAQVFGASLL
jgi:AmmeMemoRadiSam system protein A